MSLAKVVRPRFLFESFQPSDEFRKNRLFHSRQTPSFFDEAIVDMDGTMVETGAEKMEGIDIAYNGVWGYHPLVASQANTGRWPARARSYPS